ncbi:MAG TPA: L,D-transpeptidase family protein [Pseudomonadales bacterium]
MLRLLLRLVPLLLLALPVRADGGKADRIVIDKSERQLTLMRDGRPLRSYTVALGGAPKGAKRFEGDQRTPEGVYFIDYRNANSQFHRALRISYPNEADRARALDAGLDPGGQIMIHGLKNGQGWLGERHRAGDWTDGCIAVTNDEIEEIWSLVDLGTPVEIRP